MVNKPEINVPESYSTERVRDEKIPPNKTIEDIPSSTNKVRKIIIRGVLKGDENLSNK